MDKLFKMFEEFSKAIEDYYKEEKPIEYTPEERDVEFFEKFLVEEKATKLKLPTPILGMFFKLLKTIDKALYKNALLMAMSIFYNANHNIHKQFNVYIINQIRDEVVEIPISMISTTTLGEYSIFFNKKDAMYCHKLLRSVK